MRTILNLTLLLGLLSFAGVRQRRLRHRKPCLKSPVGERVLA
jgi:hypothetical protein